MDMQGSRQLAITQQQAWDALNNPEVLKTCIPGCDRVEATGENQYAIGMAVKIGPVAAKFTGKIALSEPAWQGFATEVYVTLAFIYFLFCFAMSRYSRGLEEELNRGRRR